MKMLVMLLPLICLAAPALAANGPRLNCDDLKARIDAKLQAKGVQNYSLEAADMQADDGGAKVVGTCDGNTRKMLYKRGAVPKTAAPKAAAPKTDTAKPGGK